MPTYEYECGHCRNRFEIKQGFDDEAKAACPQCKGKAKRIIRSSPIIFKGSGFYVTDSRRNTGESEVGKSTGKTHGEPKAGDNGGKSTGESKTGKETSKDTSESKPGDSAGKSPGPSEKGK
jgi:putative FmdB family regulatory protein